MTNFTTTSTSRVQKMSGTVHSHSLVTAPHWSTAICHLARWKRCTLMLLTIMWKFNYTFSRLPVVWCGGCVGEVAQSGHLSFVPLLPWPQALMYFACTMDIIHRLEINPVLAFQISGQSESATISLLPHPLTILILPWPKPPKPQSMTKDFTSIVKNS